MTLQTAQHHIRLLAQTQEDMKSCFQFETLSVYDHGVAVNEWAKKIGLYCLNSFGSTVGCYEGLRIPQWLSDYGPKLMDLIPNWFEFSDYLFYHDCGKPYCRTVDENGKQHFPDHEKVSHQKWVEVSGESPDGYIAQCILHDMDIHRIKTEDVPAFVALPQAASLLIAGLAEIHANAQMFGGIDSQGFKVKFAQIERRGKTACNLMFGSKT